MSKEIVGVKQEIVSLNKEIVGLKQQVIELTAENERLRILRSEAMQSLTKTMLKIIEIEKKLSEIEIVQKVHLKENFSK